MTPTGVSSLAACHFYLGVCFSKCYGIMGLIFRNFMELWVSLSERKKLWNMGPVAEKTLHMYRK